MSPQGQHSEAVLQRWPMLYHVLAAKLGSVKATQVVLVLKARRGHREQLRLSTVRKACERLLVKGQPSYSGRPQNFGDASTMR